MIAFGADCGENGGEFLASQAAGFGVGALPKVLEQTVWDAGVVGGRGSKQGCGGDLWGSRVHFSDDTAIWRWSWVFYGVI